MTQYTPSISVSNIIDKHTWNVDIRRQNTTEKQTYHADKC